MQTEARWLARLAPVELGAAVLLVAVGAWAAARQRPAAGWWIGAAAVGLLGGGHLWKARQNRDEGRALRAGASGEERVAEALARHFDDRHVLFNDVTLRSGLRSAQVDHLVVGPSGVWVVETKNWGGRIEGEADAAVWTQIRPAGAPRRLDNPVRQNRRHVAVVRGFLEVAGLGAAEVRAVTVFAGRGTELAIRGARSDEPVLTLDEFPARLTAVVANARELPTATVERLVARISEAA